MNENLSSRLQSLRIDRTGAPGVAPRRASRLPRTLLLALAATGIVAGVAAAAPAVRAAFFPAEVRVAEVALVSPNRARTQFAAAGYVEAPHTSRLAPKVAGRVLRSHVEQGDNVEAGQLLLELDPADEVAQLELAERRLRKAIADRDAEASALGVVRAESAEATRLARRARRLADDDVAAPADAEDLEARAQLAKQRMSAARRRLAGADASVDEQRAAVAVLRTALSNLSITAPFHGVIVNEPPRVGEYVGPQPPGVTVDMGGIRIADLSGLIVDADIPEGRFRLLRAGTPAEIVLDAYPNQSFQGRVSSVTPEVDRAKATVRVKVAFVDPAPGVLPDLAARVTFLSEEPEAGGASRGPRKVVPSAAVVTRDGTNVIFVVEGERARMQPVSVGAAAGDALELLDGPPVHARVVTDVPLDLADGAAIRVIER